MKRIFLLSIIATLALSCSKDALETFPGNKVPADVVYGSVENAQSALTGALAGLGAGGWQGNYNSGIGFGLTETYLTGDALAEDYVLSGSGSGWMWQTYSYAFKSWFDDPRLQSATSWNCYYTTINSCNNLIGAGELLAESNQGKYILGQAYVLRAFCYHMLAQLYARAYFYYPEDLCVPVYLEPTTSETKGAARSTNKYVYEEVVYPGLTSGIELLKEADEAGVKRSSKTEIDYYVANGIKARVALTMHLWKDAYGAAEEALKGYAGNEALAASQISGGMNDITALPSVMWGEIKTTDNYGMYLSFQSQMDAGHDGYAQKARRCCTSWLWNRMNSTDARRAWWLGNFDNANYQASGEAIRYCQVKFKFKGDTWLGDYIYMRAEEMLLTAAEAYCQDGNDGQARNYLSKLMAKRDPAYTGTTKSGNNITTLTPGSDGASTTGSLLEEILIQRRLELWGEYGRLFDIKRLGQGFKRVATESADNPDFDPSSLISRRDTQSPDTYAWILLLPQKELDGNPNIVQNPTGDKAN
ncbi:RagB/SusD family nutrient uptake outer membrane protein [Alistipes sp.]|uniref:RagB/SusD family nutrient uptake outer membrane protein n=1 Tax=Alistipes sp. TaxID=1872444 RepID=UPI003AF97769